MDDKDSLIQALKVANEGKDRVVCDLIKDNIAKDNEIKSLKDRIVFLEKWLKWDKGKGKS